MTEQMALERWILNLERRSREGNSTPIQYSYLENPWMEEPDKVQSMGSLRVGPN